MTGCIKVIVLALLILFGMQGRAQAQVQHLTSARASVTVNGLTTIEEVTLPYHWDRRNHGQSGTAEFQIAFDLNVRNDVLYGLYIRRLGNAYEISLNGRLLQRNGDLDRVDTADFAKAPRYVAIPQELVRQTNLLTIRIRADGGRRGGVSAPVFGQEADVRKLFKQEYGWRVDGSFAVMLLSLVVGIGGLLLWFTQQDASQPRGKGRDSLYLFAGVAEISWALRVGDAIIDQPPVDWTWWGTLQAAALAVWLSSMAIFCMKLSGWDNGTHRRLLRGFLLVFVVAGCLCGFASLQFDRTWVLTAWYVFASLFFLCFGAAFVISAWRSGDTMHRLVAIALTCNVAVGVRDVVVLRLASSYGDNSYLRYTSVLFGLVLGYVLLTRFQAATTQARELMRGLEQTLSRREGELRASYHRLEVVAREQERTLERARILRDMHDGVGSHITTAIRQLQSEKSTRSEVLDTLRDSLDHLKLSIDAIHLPPGDVAALLANLRYRLDPRFEACDIELRWAVQVIASPTSLDAVAMRHLQFILFEALSNVLQHARATVLCIEASQQAEGVTISLIDNGIGFDAARPKRKGLLSMHERAGAIGARLSVSSHASGTIVKVLLPA
jgi:signal transduction histidine kinase